MKLKLASKLNLIEELRGINMNRKFGLRNVAAFCMIVAIVMSSTVLTFAKTGNSNLAGELIISGHALNNFEPTVMLNGENVMSGRTIFSGSQITTSENSATVKLGKLGYLTLSPNSALSLNFDENNINGTLSAGDVQVFNNKGVNVNIERTGNAVKTAQTQTDDDDDDNSPVVPFLIFAGIVAGTVIYIVTNGDDSDEVNFTSPVR